MPKLVPESPRLRYLGLEDTGVCDEDVRQVLARVPNLGSLDMSSTDVTDAIMSAVAKQTQLKGLRLENTRITDAGLAMLRGLDLESLDLGLTRVTEKSAPLLIEMQLSEKLLLPAEWSGESEAALVKASPAKSDVRRSGYRFQDRPDAKALRNEKIGTKQTAPGSQ